jgi:hypothetical protein
LNRSRLADEQQATYRPNLELKQRFARLRSRPIGRETQRRQIGMKRLHRYSRRVSICAFALAASGVGAAAEEVLDQVNSPAWTGAAVSISPTNGASQSFTPKQACLVGIDVDLMTAYRGRGGDTVTLTVHRSADTSPLGSASAAIPEGFNGYWRFRFSPPLQLSAGEPVTFRVVDTGKTVFFWKHATNDPYPAGQGVFAGSRFFTNDFLFRTYGAAAHATEHPCRVAQSP